MLTYSDYFSPINVKNSYFAGANTPKGFFAEYENLMNEDSFEKIYIIKGGSGTGKSTLIRRLAKTGEKLGGIITYILCSSDPDSLDGAIIEKGDKKIAVIDGTAPHTTDPLYAGACGEIVNCGDHWNTEILEAQKTKIADIIREKSRLYSRVYRYLSAAFEICEIQSVLAGSYLCKEKMLGAVKRLVPEKEKGTKPGKIVYRRTCAVSMKGAFRLTSFEEGAKLYGVSDYGFLAPVFYEELLRELISSGIDTYVSKSPLYGIAELYLPEFNIAFVPYREGAEYAKVINMRRFISKEGMARVKEKRIFTSRCYKEMMEGALESLSAVKDCHFALEEIYRKAMDFEGLDRMGQKLSGAIEKRLS